MTYDVAVIGGGIVGVCVAREVAARGCSVALIERGELGGATSANSLRILHGGLRYLKRLDVVHADRYIREQRAWSEIAPDLVKPLRCELQLGSRPSWKHLITFAGFQLYNLLCWNQNRGRTARPLPTAGLTLSGKAYWYDLQMTAPEGIARVIAHQASSAGAALMIGLEVDDMGTLDGNIRQLSCTRLCDGSKEEIRANFVVSALGPWTAKFLREVGLPEPNVHWLQGVNALYDLPRNDSASVLRGQGGRMFLATPMGQQTLAGTGQFPLLCEPEDWQPKDLDSGPFLAQLHQMDPTFRDHVPVDYFKGLIPTASRGSLEPLQRDILLDHSQEHRFISLISCKYTSARWLAQRATDRLLSYL